MDQDLEYDLDARKQTILKVIISNYLETGEPVGSRTISKLSDLNLSSATIRNEMSDLEELGYIVQPHTSAGRVPTDKGYRFYVDNLMEEKESMNSFNYNAPIHQKLRFDYNKINFRYDPYNVHPITNKLIWKDHTKMYPFDYFNKDKDKHYVTNKNTPFINTEYRKVWDPITNRYFPGSVRCFSFNKNKETNVENS